MRFFSVRRIFKATRSLRQHRTPITTVQSCALETLRSTGATELGWLWDAGAVKNNQKMLCESDRSENLSIYNDILITVHLISAISDRMSLMASTSSDDVLT